MLEDAKYPFAITIFENEIYWSDMDQYQIEKAKKLTGSDRQDMIHTVWFPFDLHIYHPLRQPPSKRLTRRFMGVGCVLFVCKMCLQVEKQFVQYRTLKEERCFPRGKNFCLLGRSPKKLSKGKSNATFHYHLVRPRGETFGGNHDGFSYDLILQG